MCVCSYCSDRDHLRFDLLSTKRGRDRKLFKNLQPFSKNIVKKQCWIRGPMKVAIYESTEQDEHKNELIANNNYDQKSMSIF